MEAGSGFEPLNRGFPDLRLSHLATPPFQPLTYMERETGFEPATPTLARLCSTTELFPQTAVTEPLRNVTKALSCVNLRPILPHLHADISPLLRAASG